MERDRIGLIFDDVERYTLYGKQDKLTYDSIKSICHTLKALRLNGFGIAKQYQLEKELYWLYRQMINENITVVYS